MRLVLVLAFVLCLVLPSLLPRVPRVANTWLLAGPVKRWILCGVIGSLIPLLSAALAATRGNQIRAADLLGVNRNTLRKKIRDLDIQVIRTGS